MDVRAWLRCDMARRLHDTTRNEPGRDHTRRAESHRLRDRGITLDCGYRLDFIVEGSLVLELKAVECLLPVHDAQVLTYLKLLGLKQGLLINFNVAKLVDGLRSLLW
jgi:GxxExxY protein